MHGIACDSQSVAQQNGVQLGFQGIREQNRAHGETHCAGRELKVSCQHESRISRVCGVSHLAIKSFGAQFKLGSNQDQET